MNSFLIQNVSISSTRKQQTSIIIDTHHQLLIQYSGQANVQYSSKKQYAPSWFQESPAAPVWIKRGCRSHAVVTITTHFPWLMPGRHSSRHVWRPSEYPHAAKDWRFSGGDVIAHSSLLSPRLKRSCFHHLICWQGYVKFHQLPCRPSSEQPLGHARSEVWHLQSTEYPWVDPRRWRTAERSYS